MITTIEDLLGSKHENKELKKIEFVKIVTGSGLLNSSAAPYMFNHIILLQKKYSEQFDAMMAIDKYGHVFIYLGHWNDGVK